MNVQAQSGSLDLNLYQELVLWVEEHSHTRESPFCFHVSRMERRQIIFVLVNVGYL